MDKIGVKQQRPAAYRCALAVVFLAAYLPGRDAYQGAVLIIVFAAPISEIKVVVLLNEHAIHAIAVEAVAHGGYIGEIDDGYQRMRVGQAVISAVIGRSVDFQYFCHGRTGLIVRSKVNKNMRNPKKIRGF